MGIKLQYALVRAIDPYQRIHVSMYPRNFILNLQQLVKSEIPLGKANLILKTPWEKTLLFRDCGNAGKKAGETRRGRAATKITPSLPSHPSRGREKVGGCFLINRKFT
jgi:hypothetical protein